MALPLLLVLWGLSLSACDLSAPSQVQPTSQPAPPLTAATATVAYTGDTTGSSAGTTAQAPIPTATARGAGTPTPAPARPPASSPTPLPRPTSCNAPILEPGFPVRAKKGLGGIGSFPFYALVGNIDDEPGLEIVASDNSTSPLYAWHSDGTLVPGWPLTGTTATRYVPAMGNLAGSPSSLELVFAQHDDKAASSITWGLEGLLQARYPLPGWPVDVGPTLIDTVPMLIDLDSDGLDETIVSQWHEKLVALDSRGNLIRGWPLSFSGRILGYAGGDLDGDGTPEIVVLTLGEQAGLDLYAFRSDRTLMPGFPAYIPPPTIAKIANQAAPIGTSPVIGDVDGDGSVDIVVLARSYYSTSDQRFVAWIISDSGTLERSVPLQGTTYRNIMPALGDLDCDGSPEVVVQTIDTLNVVKGDGTVMSGWPQSLVDRPGAGQRWTGDSVPTIGDVDGDGSPDVVTTTDQGADDFGADMRAFRADGSPIKQLPGRPVELPSLNTTAAAAIADLDLDGRNEIIVSLGQQHTDFEYNAAWAYDLHGTGKYGAVQWGQFGGGPQHQGYFPPGTSCSK